jgi:hypothetical protein
MGDGMAAGSGPGFARDVAAEAAAAPRRPPPAGRAPDFTPRHRDGLCAPLLLGEAALAIHARLLARARELGYAETNDPALMVMAGRAALQPTPTGEGMYLCPVPPGTTRLRLISRSYVPVEANPGSGDARRLGVPLARLRFDGQEVALDDGTCVAGFHPPEGEGTVWRWTTGDATLALPARAAEATLELAIHPGWGRYWIPPPDPQSPADAQSPPGIPAA